MIDNKGSHSRRAWLKQNALAAVALTTSRMTSSAWAQDDPAPRFEISVHQYSLKPLFDAGQLKLDGYARFVKEELDLSNIEFAVEFCNDLLDDPAKADRLRQSSAAVGVKNRVLLCGADDLLDAADAQQRRKAVEQHVKWAKIAQHLGCEFIRVRASTMGDREKQLMYAADGIGALCDAVKSMTISVLIENIAGWSRDADWLVQLVERIGPNRVGLIADFGNFDGDIYAGMKQLLPHTKSICTKSWDFDAAGNETKIDYAKMMQIVKDSGFRGCISIEYLGTNLPPVAGIRKTADLIRRHS